MTPEFAKRSALVRRYAHRGVDLLYRLTGEVDFYALLALKELHQELGYRIEQCQSTAATATTPTGKAQATTGCVSKPQDTEQAS